MNSITRRVSVERGRAVFGLAVALGLTVALSGCDNLLDVSLPAQLTDEVLTDPVGATIQIQTIVNTFENEMSDFAWTLSGHEDAGEIFLMSPSASSSTTNYPATTTNFNGFMTARVFARDL